MAAVPTRGIVIVIGEVVAKPGHFDALFAAGRAHSARSRAEAGCISHDCYADPDNALKMMFIEQWQDDAALNAHFKTPGVAELVAAITAHAERRGTIRVFSAREVPVGGQ